MNDVVVKQTFEEKMSARIKEQIGDMIEADDLRKLIEKGIEKAFFEPRMIKINNWDSKEVACFMTEIVRDAIKKYVDAYVADYFKNNPDKIEPIIKDVFTQGIGNALLSAISMKFQGDMINMQQNFLNTLHRP